MKKIIVLITLIVSITAATYGAVGFLQEQSTFYKETEGVTDRQAKEAFDLLDDSLLQERYTYFEYRKEYSSDYGLNTFSAEEVGTSSAIGYEDQVTYEVTVDKSAMYNIVLTYDMEDQVMNNATVALEIDGKTPFYEANILDLPIDWQDKSKVFDLDSYGDEALPTQVKVEGERTTALYNNTYYTVEPLLFYLEEGRHELKVTNLSSSEFTIASVEVAAPYEAPDYASYRKEISGERANGSIEVNAVDYVEKNSSYVRLFSFGSPTAKPFDAVDKKLNIIADGSWRDPGKDIDYRFEVKESGFYNLALHHLGGKDDYQVFRTVRIDGKVPFKELEAYPLADTKGSRFAYEVLSDKDGTAYEFYLEEGLHTITFTADYEPVAEQVRKLQLVIDHINQFALDIRKVTGKEVDRNRTWKITEYIPETESYLRAYDTVIKDTIENCSEFAPNGMSSSSLSYLQKALVKLDKMLEDPDELPLYFEDLYSGSGSVSQMLGDTMETLTLQPLALNEFTFFGDELDRRANAPWYEAFGASTKKFISSFTSEKYLVRNDDEALNVWVNRPITHVDTLQKMVDSDFTVKTGIKVKISVMPDANKLVLASAAGEQPDVAMGLLSYMPFDLAIRGAAYDLTEFDDFWTVADRFTPGAFVPYILEDNVYALPETLEFYSLIYRKDIFDSLGLEVPDTWQEVTEMLPELQRYGMNFFHPIAGGGSLKWFYQTSSLIYQAGGSMYSDDGREATIDGEEAVKGLEFLTKLFTMYSLPEQEPLFYNAFRYGTLPVGITDFVTYMQVKNAAPELIGQWELAPYPAMEDSDGNMNRWMIANGRSSVILQDTKKAEEAWEFLKWWTSEEVQTNYSFTLQSIYGPEYLWLSGNLDAVKNSPIDIKDKEVILEQVKWLRDVPRTPGQYMLERGISDIWNKGVFDNVPTRIAIDRQVITINREIDRKMVEFGYVSEEGESLTPYNIRDIDWIIEQIEKNGGAEDE